MKKLNKKRALSFLAVTILACAMLVLAQVVHAQNPCNSCLKAEPNTGMSWCTANEPCCDTSIVWALVNTCNSCIQEIVLRSKYDKSFLICCAVDEDTARTHWKLTPYSDGNGTFKWILDAPPDSCLSPGSTLQITTCGLLHGDIMDLDWGPADPPCTWENQNAEIAIP